MTAPTPAMISMLVIMLLMIILFLSGKFRTDFVAMVILVLLAVTGLLPHKAYFSGFSSSAVIALVGIMILGAGLERSGVINDLTNWVLKLSHRQPKRLTWMLCITGGVLGGLFRSIGGLALLMPALARLSLYFQMPRSKLLMPVGFCAIVGGTLTVVGSGPLLVLNDIIHKNHFQPLGLLTTLPIGLSILITIALFFRLFGQWLLPNIEAGNTAVGTKLRHFRKMHGYGGKFHEIHLRQNSPLIGMQLGELEQILLGTNIAIVAIFNGKETVMPPLRKLRLTANTHIALLGKNELITDFTTQYHCQLQPKLDVFADMLNPMRSGLSEMIITPGSSWIDQPIADLKLRRNYHVQVLSLFRGKALYQDQDMQKLSLRCGDVLGVYSQWDKLAEFDRHHYGLIITDYPKERYHPKKRPLALLCLLIALVLSIFSHLGVAMSLLFAAIIMLGTKTVKLDQAYQAVSWSTVFLLAGLIPFGMAMQSTGTATWLAHTLLALFGHWPVWLILTTIAIIAAIFSLLMTNVGATVVLAPVAISIAIHIHADPRMFAIVTALATSNAFLIPTHQVNALITGPGGYRTRDFLKIGGLVTMLYLISMLSASYVFL